MKFRPLQYTPLELSLYLPDGVNFKSYPPNSIRSLILTSFLRAVCTRDGNCDSCYLQSSCPYTKFLRPKAQNNYLVKSGSEIPPAYSIQMNWKQKNYSPNSYLTFKVNFYADPENFLPYLVAGLRDMEPYGIPGVHKRFILSSIYSTTTLVYDRQEDKIHPPLPISISPEATPSTSCLTLHFHSPTHLKNSASSEKLPEYADFIKAISRRYSLILKFHQHKEWRLPDNFFETPNSPEMVFSDYTWHVLKREKDDNTMLLQGFTGVAHVCNVPSHHMFLFEIGQHIQIGSKTTFGFGHYSVLYWGKGGSV